MACPGEPILLGEVAGCVERLAQGMTSLRWSLNSHAFRLEGEVAPAEAAHMARSIASSFGSL